MAGAKTNIINKLLGLLGVCLTVWALSGLSIASASSITPQTLLTLHNDYRVQQGLSTFQLNNRLSAAAQQKAEDMLAKDYFEHTSPDGTTPWYWMSANGYDYRYAGENLAIDFFSAEEVMQAWINSPGHRANLVKAVYQDIGIGIASGEFAGRETTVVTVFFANSNTVEATQESSPTSTGGQTPASSQPSQPPAPKVIPPPEPATITEPLGGSYLIEDHFEIHGQAEPGLMVDVYVDEELRVSVPTDEQGNYATKLKLPDGDYSLSAVARLGDVTSAASEAIPIQMRYTAWTGLTEQVEVKYSTEVLRGHSFLIRAELEEPVEGIKFWLITPDGKAPFTAVTDTRYELRLKASGNLQSLPVRVQFQLAEHTQKLDLEPIGIVDPQLLLITASVDSPSSGLPINTHPGPTEQLMIGSVLLLSLIGVTLSIRRTLGVWHHHRRRPALAFAHWAWIATMLSPLLTIAQAFASAR